MQCTGCHGFFFCCSFFPLLTFPLHFTPLFSYPHFSLSGALASLNETAHTIIKGLPQHSVLVNNSTTHTHTHTNKEIEYSILRCIVADWCCAITHHTCAYPVRFTRAHIHTAGIIEDRVTVPNRSTHTPTHAQKRALTLRVDCVLCTSCFCTGRP